MIFLRRFFKLFLRIRGLFFPQTLSHDKTEMVVMEGFPLLFDGRISIRHGGEECRTQVITQYPRVNNSLSTAKIQPELHVEVRGLAISAILQGTRLEQADTHLDIGHSTYHNILNLFLQRNIVMTSAFLSFVASP